MDVSNQLSMSLGEAIFTLRAIRRLRPDPIPDEDVTTILNAAIRAPNGGNLQPWHFIVITDARLRSELGTLYREAWWAKRKDQGISGPEDIPASNKIMQSAMRFADEIGDAPVLILLCATARGPGPMASVIPAAQNLLLAARALGIGGTITTLHPQVENRVHGLFDIPQSAQVVYCIPLGYPKGRFGPTDRKSVSSVSSYDRWGT